MATLAASIFRPSGRKWIETLIQAQSAPPWARIFRPSGRKWIETFNYGGLPCLVDASSDLRVGSGLKRLSNV